MLSLNVGYGLYEELQDNTPIQESVFVSEERIKVTDPRHPLYGHECELVEIYQRQDGRTFCRVKVGQLGRSDVPLAATNRGIPLPVPDSLLSYASLQQLLKTYEAIVEARKDDSSRRRQDPDQERDCAPASMALADGQATSPICPEHGDNMPRDSSAADEARGGE